MPKKKLNRQVSNFAKAILQFAEGRRYSPMTAEELMTQLTVPEQVRRSFLAALDHLVSKGDLSLERSRYALKSSRGGLHVGVISVHRVKGFGFVKPEKGEEIFIPKQSMRDAIHGDTVEVEVTDTTAKGMEGRVIAILTRSRTHLACTLIEKSGARFSAYAPLLGMQKQIHVAPGEFKSLKSGDRVICQVLDWNTDESTVEAVVVRCIGSISDPSCDVAAAIEEFELPQGFTQEAIAEAKAFDKKVSTKGRLDLTHLECVTIDPETARDFDDAVSLTKDEKGHFHLGVHIADAAHYVKPGSYLDQEAQQRCNSTYFPGFCLPMLPEALSNELCSLKPDVNRLTASVLAEFDPSGHLVDVQIARSCIQSRKRFTYQEAFAVIEKKKKSPFLPLLELMVELCRLLKRKRYERGSIDFSMTEAVIIVDDQGKPLRIERHEYDITHQLIEEFMLKANELVAIHLSKKKDGLIYRIHEEPSAETFEDFFQYARTLGFSLPPKPTHSDIQKLFEQAKNSPMAPHLSVSFIRSMKLAFYSPENVGHYGLALEHYCHFTSPIRRYTDTVIQRLLFDEQPPSTNLTDIAALCSEKERLSFRAESTVKQLKKLRLAREAFDADPQRVYPAVITKVKPFALFFEVAEFDLESSIHVSGLGNDYFEYDPNQLSFRGARSGKTYLMGAPLSVRLKKIDLIFQLAEWEIAGVSHRKKR